jgi:hypothetical protein
MCLWWIFNEVSLRIDLLLGLTSGSKTAVLIGGVLTTARNQQPEASRQKPLMANDWHLNTETLVVSSQTWSPDIQLHRKIITQLTIFWHIFWQHLSHFACTKYWRLHKRLKIWEF